MSRRVAMIVLAAMALGVLAPFVGIRVPDEARAFVFWQLRVPRVLVGLLVGAMLSTAGAAFQTLFANPLTTPGTVGTTAGAVLGATVASMFAVTTGAFGLSAVTLFAFVGALAVSAVMSAIASRGTVRMQDLVLVGVVCSLAAGALSTGLQSASSASATQSLLHWSLGRLAQVGYEGVPALAGFAVVTIGAMLTQAKALDALANGEERAHAQGVSVARVRTFVILAASLGVAASVAWCGPIAFVDLIVPHIVRRALGGSRRGVLWLSALCGGVFLALCDAVGRVVVPGRELPVGVITAAIGAGVMVVLLTRSPR